MHEHVFVVDAEYAVNNYSPDFVESIIADAAAALNALAEAGIHTIVDCTVLGIGRMVPWLREVAGRTSVHIVLATGVYVTGELIRMFGLRGPGTPLGGSDPMTAMFIRELTEGIGGSGVRAGVLKCATDAAGVTPGVDRVLRAVADASVVTGAPIMTHSDALTRQGLAQQQIFAEQGVDLSRVVIGHSADTDDLDYLLELIGNGSYVGMDRFTWKGRQDFDARIAMIVALCRRGHADRVVLSEDASSFHTWMDEAAVAELAPGSSAAVVPSVVVPRLLREGVAAAEIDQMLIHNPRRLLSPPQHREAAHPSQRM
jgi:phosphotriesterase-related protein